MKLRNLLITAFIMASPVVASAQQTIKLPKPDLNRKTLSVAETYSHRRSFREFGSRKLSQQDLSDLLWAAQGQNGEDGRLTSPTAMNKQEIRIYVFCEKQVSLYDPHANTLTVKATGDHRSLLAAGQDFVRTAPVVLLYVADGDAFGNTSEFSQKMMAIDAGIVSQNVNIFCSAAGFVTVPRVGMESEEIIKLLGLNRNQFPMLNNPVGYPKE